jgi:branched-chain amino acid transport system substrate-binding protein
MKRRAILSSIVLLVVILAAPPVTPAQEYRIGVVAAITGPASSLGVPERDVAVLLQKQLEAAGGLTAPDGRKRPVRILVYDDQSKADETVKLVKKLVMDDGVHVVIASSQSPTSLAVVPIATEAKVPLISMASSHAIVTPIRDRYWVFKTPQSNVHVAVHQVNYLRSKGLRKIASLYVNDAFGEDSRRGLAEMLKRTGIEVVYEDKFEHADKDMTPQLTRVRSSGAQALIVHAIPPSASIVTKNVRDLGLTIPLLHNHGVGNKPFIDLAGGAAEGVIFPIGKMLVAEDLPAGDPQKQPLLDFIAWYEKGTGKPRSTFAGHAWDALQMVLPILAGLPPDLPLPQARARIRDELERVRGFAGTGGVFTMSPEDHVGLDERSMVLVRVTGGRWQYFPPEKW